MKKSHIIFAFQQTLSRLYMQTRLTAIRATRTFILLTLLTLIACNGNNTTGIEVQPPGDGIIVGADTFVVATQNLINVPISATTDTLILGTFYSPRYGATKADLLVQFAPPIGYRFPDEAMNPQPDSLVLLLYYKTWFGSAYSPFEVAIYELNKEGLSYSSQYLSNLDISLYTDTSILMGKRVATSIDLTRVDSTGRDTAVTPYVRYKFNEEQVARFFNMPHDIYESSDAFLNAFKGIYITTPYGSATQLHLSQVSMFLYYHYTYTRNGKDTIVNTSIDFPANKEVRQLNRFVHPEIEQYVANCPDSVLYIKSAGGIYPKLSIPLGRIAERIRGKIGDKDIQINAAELVVEGIEFDENEVFVDPPRTLMAITADEFEDFLRYYTLPATSDTKKIVAEYSTTNNSYTFNLNYYLTKYLRHDLAPDATIDVMLVPVDINSSSSGITRIRPQSKYAAITVRSGSNTTSPMRLRVLYSGF